MNGMPPPRQTESPAPHGEGDARRPTLKDVAARAGVSLSTASLAFSGRGPVAEATIERVRVAAEDIGYAGPDPVASSLRAGRCGVVAVIVEAPLASALRDPYALQVLDGLADELGREGLGLLLLAQDPQDLDELTSRVSTMAMDAAVFPFCGPAENPLVDALSGRGIPLFATGAPDHPTLVQLTTDEAAAQSLAVSHLFGLGHTRIGHITLPLSPGAATGPVDRDAIDGAAYPDAKGRALGFLATMPRTGADDPGTSTTTTLIQSSTPDLAEGEAAARLLLDRPVGERPTAIVAQSDLLAAGALRAAAALGLGVPEDLSVTGYDGVDLPWLDHTLTTIVQPGTDKGRRLGQMVRSALSGEMPVTETFEVALRIGTTTAPPA